MEANAASFPTANVSATLKGHIAQNCPGGANEVNVGPGGAAGSPQGEQPQGLGQPLPGAYSVEIAEVTGKAEEDEAYQLQHEEKRRRKRKGKLNLTAD